MSEVVLINPFELPAEKADAFLFGWERARDPHGHDRLGPGSLGAARHRRRDAVAE
jgi:hypothetical protein